MSRRLTKSDSVLRGEGLHKHYKMGDQDLHVLRGVDITVQPGEWVAIIGASGCGKSTLLHLLGGLDRPNEGSVRFGDEQIFRLSGGALDLYRNLHVGFVFQFYHLLPELTAVENVLTSAMISRSVFKWLGERREIKARATQLLDEMGLGQRLSHRPSKLSGGERQRVAIARALINEPDVLLADEPTGNLDAETGEQILKRFDKLHRAGQTIVMVTHDQSIARRADRILKLERGRLVK